MNSTAQATPTVLELFASHVDRTPDAVAVVDGDRVLTYRQLDEHAGRLAGRLISRGIRRGDRVAVMMDRSADLLVALLAVWKAGAVLPFFDRRKGGIVGRMRDTASVRVVPTAPFSLGGAREAASLVQDLISLATHRAAGVIWLRLEVAETEPALLPDGRPAPRRHANVLYSPTALGRGNAKAVDHHRVLFTCESIPFEEVVPRWYEAHGRLQAATRMVLGLRYAPARYVENNLLTAVGAAEVLHRGLRIDEKPFPRAEFRAMRDAMLKQVPERHRERFKGVIRNDPTLRDRLYALAARPDQDAIALLTPDVDRWAERTTRARNDLTHEGKTPNHRIEELIAVVEVTTAVVILNLCTSSACLPSGKARS
ncbi:AMP-binding protein [Streptomyces decoyicus]